MSVVLMAEVMLKLCLIRVFSTVHILHRKVFQRLMYNNVSHFAKETASKRV